MAMAYWEKEPNTAPIKEEYILWDVFRELRNHDDDDESEKKPRGQNRARTFDKRAGTEPIRLCNYAAVGRPCERPECKWSHSVDDFMREKAPDLDGKCPFFVETGMCPYGFKCRFGNSHIQVQDGSYRLLYAPNGVSLREMNVVEMAQIKTLRGKFEEKFPKTAAYLAATGIPVDQRDLGKAKRQKKDNSGQKGNNHQGEGENNHEVENGSTTQNGNGLAQTGENENGDVISDATGDISESHKNIGPDLSKVRFPEKKRLHWRDKMYLAPLTTVGNLPFRRICVDNGAEITVSEMGVANEFLGGNSSEWSLVRRHPCEKMFGIQICGSRPQLLVPAGEALAQRCEMDFVDVNCGCPIDLVFNKGGGSAMMAHAARLGQSIMGLNCVLGDVPVTVKFRTGVTPSAPVAHKLIPRGLKEWHIAGTVLHGRSRQQRYKTRADWDYIRECVECMEAASEESGLPRIPVFGNGDCYDFRDYYDHMQSGVDGIMVARGALIKPWIFTEIKERRDWDISSRERLDLIGNLARYGMEHWGSDTQGINSARRFLCEALSFLYRYVPVGLLERLPASMNDRPYPFRGRDDLETLLASPKAEDWVKISSMFLGPAPDGWVFTPKHKSNG